MQTQNQENITPNFNTSTPHYIPPYYATQGYPPVQPPEQEQSTVEHRNMFGMNRPTDPAIVQLLQHMKQMEENRRFNIDQSSFTAG